MSLLLGGCMVGPKYVKPTVPMAPAFKEQPPQSFKESDGWKPAQPGDQTLRGKWWEIFGDPQLNALEEELTPSNQDLKVAEARFRQARAMIRFNRSVEFPTISTSPSIVNERYSANQPYFPTSLANNGTGAFSLPFDLSYEVDLWGRVRRTVSASREEAQATAADLQTANLSLHAELAVRLFRTAKRGRAEATSGRHSEGVYRCTATNSESLRGWGSSQVGCCSGEDTTGSSAGADTDITVIRAQFEHAIATLIGNRRPSSACRRTASYAPPSVIPVGMPSSLLERRPDIAAGERRVAEANDQIGIARAASFPRCT